MVSVTQQAIVNQVTDENDDVIQHAMYWRQALDLRTWELSVSAHGTFEYTTSANISGNRRSTESASATSLEILTRFWSAAPLRDVRNGSTKNAYDTKP